MISELQLLSLLSKNNAEIVEIKEISFAKWRNLASWSLRPIGSNSIFS